ncbi:hypothetical protein [Nocardia sp. NPDC050717]|uniref:hypothetical protein n=1 Tax=Nocardia sp. NPDC050717 TaxID=3157221 RepID=UPI0034050CEE
MLGLVWVQMGLAGMRVVEEMWDPKVDVDWAAMQLENQLELGIGAVFAVLLGLGGALLLARRAAGLTMVLIGSGLGVFVNLGPIVTDRSAGLNLLHVGLLLGSVLVLVAAVLPATHRWVEACGNAQATAVNTPRPPVPPYN